MNRHFTALIQFYPLLLLSLLFAQGLFAQRRYYTESEFQDLIQRADTVIYKYPQVQQSPLKRMVIARHPFVEVDWEEDLRARRPLFAIKSNLLYDAITAVNLEIEIPIASRYSLAAEWIFPWWLSDSRQRAFQLLCGTVEGRYWLGQREEMEQLTGWALGLYVGGGYYDLEWDGTGYQGEGLLVGGFAATYAHSIAKDLRLEYSVGLGVVTTKYRKYSAQECGNSWNLLRTSRGHRWYCGPTRCRVSLSWMLHCADKRGGAR